MENKQNEVLLRISNLKQYFPLKKGRFVKANDGISIDIYKGETFGLVGESGCGKSTLGRTILQLYPQTYGRTMYYGRDLDDIAPEYVTKTVKNLKSLRTKWIALRAQKEAFEESYALLSEEEQYAKHAELDALRKREEDALLNMTKIVGGFITVENLDPVIAVYGRAYAIANKISLLNVEREKREVTLADAEYASKRSEEKGKGPKTYRIARAKAKLAETDDKLASLRETLSEVSGEIQRMRNEHAGDPEFQKYEVYRDSGIDLARLKYNEMRRLRRDMQLIFQDPYSSLNPRMSVGQIISEGMQAHNIVKKKDERMQDMVLKVMDECGLAPYFLHRFPHQFSGGQRQRIGIARALATKPKFVVCDEAVSALDVSIQAQIINLLLDLKEQENLTYLFITHDLSVVKYISDRIGVMYLGNMVELADSQEIFDHPLHPYTEALLYAIPTTDTVGGKKLEILEGDIPSPVNPPKGCKFHTRCKYCTDICKQVVPEWEEISPNHFVACHHHLEMTEK